MIKPKKRNNSIPWNELKAEYELGKSIAFLCEKYQIAKSTLSMKIKRNRWVVVNSKTSILKGFESSCEQVVNEIVNEKSEAKKEAFVSEVSNILKDTNLMKTNRELLVAFQGLMLKGVKNNLYKTPYDIKAGVSSVKDIENIANPQAKINLQNNNLTQKVELTKNEIETILKSSEDI